MPDFDVEAVGLSSPPVFAPVTTYRPAVRVRNNGIHPADVTGVLRIYQREPPGALLETHQLSLVGLLPTKEGDALSSGYWVPTLGQVGKEFLFAASVTTDKDQKPNNDQLSPVTVLVTGAEPPPPPPVTAHATQHESGGADAINVEGLHGTLSDGQNPASHKSTHEAGGADMITVDGLPGQLLEGQPIADHHLSHEYGGGDQLDVGGLHGTLADNQPALLHDNARHDPNYATITELNNHLADSTDVHAAATNLEQTANKGAANGYPGLGANSLVPSSQLGSGAIAGTFLSASQQFLPAHDVAASAIADAIDISDANARILLSWNDAAAGSETGRSYDCIAEALVSTTGANTVTFILKAGVSLVDLTPIATHAFSILPSTSGKKVHLHLSAQQLGLYLRATGFALSDLAPALAVTFPTTTYKYTLDHVYLQLTAQLASAVQNTHVIIYLAALKTTR